MRESPLYKTTGKAGDRHYLAYPSGPTVKKAKQAFLEQKNNFVKGTFVLDRHPRNEHLFPKDKGWSEIPCETPEGTVTPLQIFVMELSHEQDHVIRYTTERHSLQFQGAITVSIHISEPTRQAEISYAVFCLKKKKKNNNNNNNNNRMLSLVVYSVR